MDILTVPLNIIYFVRFSFESFLQISFFIGQTICQLCASLWSFCSNIYFAMVIIIIELHQFLISIFTTLDDVFYDARNLLNCCCYTLINVFNRVGNAIYSYTIDVTLFFKTVSLWSMEAIYNCWILLRSALFLMCDISLWTIMLFPRLIWFFLGFCHNISLQFIASIKQIVNDLFENFFMEMIRLLFGILLILYLYYNGIRIIVWCLTRLKCCLRKMFMFRLSKKKEAGLLEKDDGLNVSQICVICFDQPKKVLLLPCKHLCLCKFCAELYTLSCPLCRKEVHYQMVVYT